MSREKESRGDRILPKGVPRYVRCYDNGGKTWDRYTIVFTGRYTHKTCGESVYLGCSTYPFHPQGFGQHGFSENPIDRPRYGHIGKKVVFSTLPPDVQRCAITTYKDLWDL